MERKNYNRLLVSLTDRIMVWLEEMTDSTGVDVPYLGHNTALHMAEASMGVLAAVSDLRNTLIEHGEIEE